MEQEPEPETSLKAKIHKCLGWRHGHYPASMPVTLRKYHLENLHPWSEYVVTYKKSSTRALIYHGMEGLFWYGKDGRIRTLFLDNLPVPTETEFTILDAEWVPAERIFYIGDALIVRGREVRSCTLLTRLTLVRDEWLEHKKPSPRDQFKILIKEHWDSVHMSQIPVTPEGFLIRENLSPYKAGRDTGFWHWKIPETMKILMRIKSRMVGNQTCYSLWASTEIPDQEQQYCEMPHLTNSPYKWPSGAIVECRFEQSRGMLSGSGNHWITGLWNPISIRTDKSHPDPVKQVWVTANTINENLTKHDLEVAFVENKTEVGVEWTICA